MQEDLDNKYQLKLRGQETTTIYQAILRNIAFTNASEHPWRSDIDQPGSRRNEVDISWTIYDSEDVPAIASSKLKFENFKPVIEQGSGYISGITNPLPIDALLDIDGVDDHELQHAEVLISGAESGDTLIWDAELAEEVGISASYGEFGEGHIRFENVASINDYEALLRSVTYEVDWAQTIDPASYGLTRNIGYLVTDNTSDDRGYRQGVHLDKVIHIAQILTDNENGYSPLGSSLKTRV